MQTESQAKICNHEAKSNHALKMFVKISLTNKLKSSQTPKSCIKFDEYLIIIYKKNENGYQSERAKEKANI